MPLLDVMVQAGVRKIYYFPAEKWEMEGVGSGGGGGSEIGMDAVALAAWKRKEEDRKEKNKKSVARLVSNNPIAMTLYIPQWDHADFPKGDAPDDDDLDNNPFDTSMSTENSPTRGSSIPYPFPSLALEPAINKSSSNLPKPSISTTTAPMSSILTPHIYWKMDASVGKSPGIATRWHTIQRKFWRTCVAISLLDNRYRVNARLWGRSYEGTKDKESQKEDVLPGWARHAMVLAHIAARRTDDPKLGVGCVLVDDGRYFSVGWNGYPKKAQHLDYPQAGADDSVEDEELKYDYILHSEQNALLWRNPSGYRIPNGWLICTKMPCDECSPMLHDCGVANVVTVPQLPKSPEDPARLRGLTYDRVVGLMQRVLVFEVQ
ncbi:Cytidine and dCMP deaminase domain-containing protein 1 [Blyttiomyces sp. JEL0837]|nr:Cytidine and dCMP deaminase domain-containing protein 1 [Blyttiomyces sp. JEL0837]